MTELDEDSAELLLTIADDDSPSPLLLLDLALELDRRSPDEPGMTDEDEDSAELLLDLVLLLDTLVSLSFDFGVTLEEDPSSQSSHTLDDESPAGGVTTSLLSSPHATKNAVKISKSTRCIDPRLREDDCNPG